MTVEDKNAKTYALNYGTKQKEQMSTVKAAPWAR